jgi:hypothetical protein
MKIKQIMPAPQGWVCVTMQLTSLQGQDVVYPRAEPVLALALAFDEVEDEGVVVPLAQCEFGDSVLVVPTNYQDRRLVQGDTSMTVFLEEAEREAERVTTLRRLTHPDALAVKAMIPDPAGCAPERSEMDALVRKLRDEGRVFDPSHCASTGHPFASGVQVPDAGTFT